VQLHNEAVPNTLVFNAFVFAQIFTYTTRVAMIATRMSLKASSITIIS
jgi:hypothetical protein